jgi:hypothetical protein
VLDLIAKMRQHDASACVRLDGATKHDLRAGIVDRFQQHPGISVFLLSTKAGGTAPLPSLFYPRFLAFVAFHPPNVCTLRTHLCSFCLTGVGLNLVAASRLILVDLSWNPSDDAQAWSAPRSPYFPRVCFEVLDYCHLAHPHIALISVAAREFGAKARQGTYPLCGLWCVAA